MRVMLEALVAWAAMWLREPVLCLAWLLVVAILFGAGKAVGLPMLFWNEKPWRRFAAGAATTLLTAEINFVLYLIEYGHQDPGPYVLHRQFLFVGVIWGAIVLYRSAQLGFAERRPAPGGKGEGAPTGAAGLTPGVRTVLRSSGDEHHLGPMVSSRISPGPFLAGVLAGATVTAALLLIDLNLAPPVDAWASGLYQRIFGHPPLENLHLHVAAAVVFGLLAVLFATLRSVATPAIGLCMLLALLAGFYGFVTFWLASRGLVLVVLAGLLWLGGRPIYKVRLSALEPLYPPADPPATGWKPVAYPPTQDLDPGTLGPPLLLDELVRPDGRPGAWSPAPTPNQGKRPLVLVCTSGGGIRAAAWTAAILGQLDAVRGWRLCTRMVTGASGGMVGAALWVAWRRQQALEGVGPFEPAGRSAWKNLLDAVASDSLTALARQLFFHDVPLALWPRPNFVDRARALENAWIAHARTMLRADLDVPLAALRDGESADQWPSLVFSPMLVEDGRRLILSNLSLGSVLKNQARWLPDGPGGPAALDTSSVTAYHGAALFPTVWRQFPLSTAARLSAAFPYISPAAVLPTEPRRRIVDAGYYDNYGLDLACNWLRDAIECHADWLRAHVSRVLIIQIRDGVSDLSVNPGSKTETTAPLAPQRPGRWSRGAEGLSTPPEGLLAARDSVSLFRNDAQLETVTQLYRRVLDVADFVTTAVFEFKGQASLSWYLTRLEIASLKEQATVSPIQEKIDQITAWLLEHGGVPGGG